MGLEPVIAITPNVEEDHINLKHKYSDSVAHAGGIPLVVPHKLGRESAQRICKLADGLLLTGGADVDPSCFGEQPIPGLGRVTPSRDALELLLIEAFMAAGKPVFAICRGIQILNVALGGSLYQDIATQCRPLQHSQLAPRSHLSHIVNVTGGSLLHRIAGAVSFKTNSFHHQAVKLPAPGMRITATSEDGIIEAIEHETHPFVLGVQWHPEDTAASDDVSRLLFEAFVGACRSRAL